MLEPGQGHAANGAWRTACLPPWLRRCLASRCCPPRPWRRAIRSLRDRFRRRRTSRRILSRPTSRRPISRPAASRHRTSRRSIRRPAIRFACGSKASSPRSITAPPIPAAPTRSSSPEDAIAKQQADLDRAIAQAHKAGCAGEGFFALFSALSPQCGPITSQIQQMRGNLDRMTSDLEQLKSGTSGQADQRRALIGQLAQNNCGAQYTAAANSQGGPQGFFDALFGGGTIVNPNGDGAPTGTYHTVCVRTCDGYYFPISYSTLPSHFADDDQLTCQRVCPAAEVALYSYRNPGEEHGSGGVDQRPALHGAADRISLSQAARLRLLLPQAGRELGRCAQERRRFLDARERRHRRHRSECESAVASRRSPTASSRPRLRPQPCRAIPSPMRRRCRQRQAQTPLDDAKRPVRVVGPPFLSSSQMPSRRRRRHVRNPMRRLSPWPRPSSGEPVGSGSGVPGSVKRLTIG